ncbi:hypothetical protein [Staphylococcus hominis]|uniref:hypothetical protein n=1 Tax=Staphylococcus hominis TaxID=1290 RepID=UPI00024E165B|nr:hypothetical protein [Staphylococcus hominis]EHR86211.1 putative lipoprotein [Staphylococcus hominis VCU122]MDS3859006.1 hypothetical protein [Staphylococcus hominis]
MKRLLGTLFAATLVLSACSQDDTKEDENKKSESTTEKKADDKKDKNTKEDKKSKEEKKSQENEDNESTQEDNSTEEQDTQETATNEQVQSQQQTQETATQEQQQTQQANNNQNSEYDSASGLLNQDQMKANARVAKENGYTGIPNGDIGAAEEMEAYAKQRYEEDKNINDEDVEEFTPEEQQAAMEQHDRELEQEGLK